MNAASPSVLPRHHRSTRRTAMVRDSLLSILRESPEPLSTRQLQDAHADSDARRVVNQLVWLWDHHVIDKVPGPGCAVRWTPAKEHPS